MPCGPRTKPPSIVPYFIDPDGAEASRRSLPVLVANQALLHVPAGLRGRADRTADPQDFIDLIVGHCSNEQDFLLPDTPMKEAIFRVLLGNSNEPMDAEEISADLSSRWPMTRITSPEVIQRLLDNSAYYCIGPVPVSEDDQETKAITSPYRRSGEGRNPEGRW